MYKLIKYEGKSGLNKIDLVAESHSLEGEFNWKPKVGGTIGFVYNDASGKMLHSSTIEEITEEINKITITTRNSIFVFEKIEVNNE